MTIVVPDQCVHHLVPDNRLVVALRFNDEDPVGSRKELPKHSNSVFAEERIVRNAEEGFTSAEPSPAAE